MTILRNEYPRPAFVRRDWLSLNGEWEFDFDDANLGLVQNWVNQSPFRQKIIVPFPYQSRLSGIGDRKSHPVIWYRRKFQVPNHWSGRRIILHFGAVDFAATIWMNGTYLGSNTGGYVPFSFDITDYLINGDNQLVLRVVDDEYPNHPRGKQSAKEKNWACWYTRVSGIWQSVWLEPLSEIYLKRIKFEPDIDREELLIHYGLNRYSDNIRIRFKVTFHDQEITEKEISFEQVFTDHTDLMPLLTQITKIAIANPKLWTPEIPNLYDIVVQVIQNGQIIDEVCSYFGMRKLSVDRGRICLNNKTYYLRMVLDQGLWPDGIYTPGSVAELKKDIEMTKAFGFNGARKHQKIEDPYYYYYCDQLGLLVWSEMPSSYFFDANMVFYSLQEWQRAIERDYNHPCIMAWVPVNESWGVQPLHNFGTMDYQKAVHYLETVFRLTKSLDSTRLVVDNDGWQHATTDIVTIHDYTQDEHDLAKNYQSFKRNRHVNGFHHGLPTILPGYEYQGQPVMISEFGGVKVNEQGADGWGYGDAVRTYPEMGERIQKLIRTIRSEAEICGFCYTQLTDTEQEVNGLMDSHRVPKLAPNKLAEIFSAE